MRGVQRRVRSKSAPSKPTGAAVAKDSASLYQFTVVVRVTAAPLQISTLEVLPEK